MKRGFFGSLDEIGIGLKRSYTASLNINIPTIPPHQDPEMAIVAGWGCRCGWGQKIMHVAVQLDLGCCISGLGRG